MKMATIVKRGDTVNIAAPVVIGKKVTIDHATQSGKQSDGGPRVHMRTVFDFDGCSHEEIMILASKQALIDYRKTSVGNDIPIRDMKPGNMLEHDRDTINVKRDLLSKSRVKKTLAQKFGKEAENATDADIEEAIRKLQERLKDIPESKKSK